MASPTRDKLMDLEKRLQRSSARRRDDERNYSLEGLRLVNVLKQVQALQAVEGLAAFRPNKDRNRRFQFSEDPVERMRQRQWLAFKADWLAALLDDACSEIEALDAFEETHGSASQLDPSGGDPPCPTSRPSK